MRTNAHFGETPFLGNVKRERVYKLQEAEPPDDIKWVFSRYSENGVMTIDHLHKFLIESQNEIHATKEDAHAIFSSLKHLKVFQRKGLHLEAFFRYLLGDLNLAFSSHGVHHDMEAPLAHYYLFTGHNSYLTGNQLSSDSSVNPIITALRRGVRVIELDLWPNPKKNDVNVCHGGTLTAPVELIKCLRAIKENAFYASEFPLVLTFEDHLTPHLQAKVARMVTKTFGAMLFRPESEYLKEFPSPASLKNKIIISTKPPEENLETRKMMEIKDSEEEKDLEKEESFEKEITGGKSKEADNKQDEQDGGEYNQDDENVTNASPYEYRRLIAIHAGKPKGGKDKWLSIDLNKVKRLSLSEQELEDVAESHGTDIVRFTQRNLLRIYPKGTRFDSSNYNPFVGWMHGAQMVAFNMQGYGKYLWIMNGMFRANGGCGYVKKPDFLLNTDRNNEVFNPNARLPVKTTLRVKVYMGEGWHSEFSRTHFDRFSPPDFFAKVGIAGVRADSKTKETNVIEDEWVPVWDEELEFPLTVPELALLRVEVLEYDATGIHDFGGQTCLPLSELRSGVRAVPLHNRKGVKYKYVKLLMGFEFEHH